MHSFRTFAKGRYAVAIGLLTVVATACGNKPLDTLSPNSPIGGEINRLFWGVMIIAGIVFVLVQGVVIYMARRFKVSVDDPSMLYPDEEFPEQIHGNERLEVGWTILPAILMAVIGVFTLITLTSLDEVSATEHERRIDHVTVVGQQWWWEYHYYLADNPDEVAFVTVGEIVLPVDEEIPLDITSRDVIHSFWIPRLNGKRDAVPGRVSPWTLEASKVDRFLGQCTEFCGLSHAYMRMYAVSLPLEKWDDWAENQATSATLIAEGEENYEGQQLFLQNCASCHVVNGVTDVDGDEVPDDWSLYGFRESDSDLLRRIIQDPDVQASGAAPNLTHLMTRSSYAGSIFDLYENAEAVADRDYVNMSQFATVDRGQLEAWIRNAPAEKANAWDSPQGQRGMTPFAGLTGEQLDDIVDYLITLD